MKTLASILTAMLLAGAYSPATADEAPSWFVGIDDSTGVEVHVAKVIKRGDKRIDITQFAPMLGKAYAKKTDSNGDFVGIPVIVVAPQNGMVSLGRGDGFAVLIKDGKRTRTRDAVFCEWDQHPRMSDNGQLIYTMAFFHRFKLKNVVGFEMTIDGHKYELTIDPAYAEDSDARKSD